MAERTVFFRNNDARFSLNYPKALTDLPVGNLRKLFTYMVTDYVHDNSEAIQGTTEAIEELIEVTKQAWHEASVKYQDGFLSTDQTAILAAGCYYKNQQDAEIKRRKRNNEKLTAAVKSAKHKHERFVKLKADFEAMKAKYLN